MIKNWQLLLAFLLVTVFMSGCAKRELVREEAYPEKASLAAGTETAKVPEKNLIEDKEAAGKRAEREKSAQEAMLKARAEEAMAKEKAKNEKAAVAVLSKKRYEISDIHFGFDKYNLNEEARLCLNKHADWLNDNENVKIVVEGHCDERGTAEYNLALGQRRANTAARYLFNLGIDEKRIKTISYGLELPVDLRHDEEAWAKNRRVHFVISGK